MVGISVRAAANVAVIAVVVRNMLPMVVRIDLVSGRTDDYMAFDRVDLKW